MKTHYTTHATGLIRADLDVRVILETLEEEARTYLFKTAEEASANAGIPLSDKDMRKVRVTVTVQEVDDDL